jgi:EAL domain-containing protein (putative c-di-GMP-specific phosphodiesterase class I)
VGRATVEAGEEVAVARVLFLDDDEALARTYARGLSRFGHAVDTAANAETALGLLGQQSYDVVVSDVRMPGVNGIDFLSAVRELDRDMPVVMATGLEDLDTAIKAITLGAFRYLHKPVDLGALDEVVRKASQIRTLSRLKREALSLAGVQGRTLGDRLGLEARFSKGVDRLWIGYQPIVAWAERRLFGYEALLRTDEPSLARPIDFLDAAERLGRLSELGRVIRGRVAAAEAPAGINLFLNLHATDLEDDELFDPRSPLAAMAKQVFLELTELASLDAVRDLVDRVATLRRLGYRIAIDNLGAGDAGTSYVTRLEPEIVKLDPALVRGVDTEVAKERVVASMLRLFADMGTGAVVVGVETPGERDLLARIGCGLMQGYLFGRPARGFPVPQW